MDDLDLASEREDLERQSCIHRASQAGPRLKPIGRCYSCDEPVDGLRLFCCLDCSERWELERRRR